MLVIAIVLACAFSATAAFAATKNVDCATCHGQGRVDCHTCHGDGEIWCTDCGGSGTKDCPYCDEGMVVCGACGGWAVRDCEECFGGLCIHCEGSGWEVWPELCPECNGTLIAKCDMCDGTLECFECGGSGDCPECGGVNKESCLVCDGTGECEACGGSGECGYCGETGTMECDSCDNGYLSEGEDCPYCDNGVCSTCHGEPDEYWVCGECGGEGYFNCDRPECDDGVVSCPTCHEDNIIDCPDCANGHEDCSVCKGSGFIAVTAYTVTYVIDPGTSEETIADTNLYAKGEIVTVSNKIPTLTGNSFYKWSDGTAEYLIGSGYVMGEENVTFTAVYNPNNYQISFVTGDSALEYDPVQVTYGLAYGDLPEPERSGYEFLGWFIGTEKIESDSIVGITEDTNLVASWNKIISKQGKQDENAENVNSYREPVFTGTIENPVANGTWAQNFQGQWSYGTSDTFRNTWAYIANPYATNDAIKTAWFYFDGNGIMQTGWQLIDGKWYYFHADKDGHLGTLYVDTVTPDGHVVGKDGARID